ncbi:SCO family protein [Methylovirgula sp. 4M-Z18]|uniref:SCO family protein n=1 Tax=Methylovirgula sp. 4M-Z18 TaxID=2293567 RepID=UPI000E2F9E49|nr:SCO family protein [Methylovirgula sp. 4M-Z18]RFB79257.1 SCO family protein [Methylovirgula sp. 4M-Z18]
MSKNLLLPAAAFVLGTCALIAALWLILVPQVGAPLPSGIGGPFALVAQDGKSFTDKDMLGKPTLIFFGYTHCPDVCPTTLFDMSEVLRKLGPDKKVAALFITVDPERDTPEVLKDYLSSFDPRIVGLSGDRTAVEAAMRNYRVYAKKVPANDGGYTMDHTSLIYLMDKQGRFVNPFNLERTPEEAAKDLAKYL